MHIEDFSAKIYMGVIIETSWYLDKAPCREVSFVYICWGW